MYNNIHVILYIFIEYIVKARAEYKVCLIKKVDRRNLHWFMSFYQSTSRTVWVTLPKVNKERAKNINTK